MDDDAYELELRRRRFVTALTIFGLAVVALVLLLAFVADAPGSQGDITPSGLAKALTFLAIPVTAGLAAANVSSPKSFVLRILMGLIVAVLTFAVLALIAISVAVANGAHMHF
jgi:hypothetical protein